MDPDNTDGTFYSYIPCKGNPECLASEAAIPVATTDSNYPGTCDSDTQERQVANVILGELQLQLTTLFLTAIIVQNSLEVSLSVLLFLIFFEKNLKKLKQMTHKILK